MSETHSVTEFCAAKVNLMLAITGVRDDGFHSLVSLVTPLEYGDTLSVSVQTDTDKDRLNCDYPGVPTGPENLVLKAAEAFRQQVPDAGYFSFNLEKNIPPGAGLGGGSSNAAAALRGMNRLLGEPLATNQLCEISATLGSDCPLFVESKPIVMSGRGEILEPLPQSALDILKGLPIIVFRPDFGISTAWAYDQMKASGKYYLPEAKARELLNTWLKAPADNNLPLYNNLQDPVFKKHLALPTLLNAIKNTYNIEGIMSGSGSSCFVLPKGDSPIPEIKKSVMNALGENCLFEVTRLA